MRQYSQLTKAQRSQISKMRSQGISLSQIARCIGVHKSTVSREIKRNGSNRKIDHRDLKKLAAFLGDPVLLKKASTLKDQESYFEYLVKWAQRNSKHRRFWSNQARTRKHTRLRNWVIARLKKGWSPTQIAGRSALDGPESISHEAIYQIIHRDKLEGGGLYRFLPRFGKRIQRFNARDYAAEIIPHRVDIRQRPKIVDQRTRLGDLEADLITGYKSDGYVLVVVDRTSRQVALRKLQRKTKLEVLTQLLIAAKSFPQLQTLTTDNGREFCAHQTFTQITGVPCYFTTPYSSQERGTVENTNGLIRRILRKKQPFASLTQSRLNRIQHAMNHRPRKIIGFLTPIEAARIFNSS